MAFAQSYESSYQEIIVEINQKLNEVKETYESRINSSGLNAPTPELGDLVESVYKKITMDPQIAALAKKSRALNALLIQTKTHLEHVRMTFEMGSKTYPHDYALKGAYPLRPTVVNLEKAKDFFQIIQSHGQGIHRLNHVIDVDLEREKQLMDESKSFVKKVTNDSYNTYHEMRERLLKQGGKASFPELGPTAEYLNLKLMSDPKILKSCSENVYLASFRTLALEKLNSVISPDAKFPYLKTIDAIERTTEFLDVVQRHDDPTRSPKLYHSGRYEYYIHFLKADFDHISMPTIASLGATDILRARGVPIGFWGVNTDVTWVDGHYQTSYEFLIHDVNHTRRMFQFQKEEAARQGLSIDEFSRRSDLFIKETLMPMISIKTADSDIVRNKKRLLKVLLFEILHEDALPASKKVIEEAVLRPPMQLTPFENIESGNKVKYVMEPGATTLAYVFRKLAHDFYDMPGERLDNIVGQSARTRENIVEVAEKLFSELGLNVKHELMMKYAFTDKGFPDDFRETLVRDIKLRPNETIPLNQKKPVKLKVVRCEGLFN